MNTYKLIVKEVLFTAFAITAGAILMWLLLATGYHLGTMETKGRVVVEKGPVEVSFHHTKNNRG